MNLEQIDHWLADWNSKLDRVSQNLIDLHDLGIYQQLTANPQQLIGTSQTQVRSALEAMDSLCQSFELLVRVIDQANQLRKQISRFRTTDPRIEEIAELLTGTSIALPVTQIPLAQRDLLSAPVTANAITPADLLTVMNNAFQVARDTVLAVEVVWSRLEPRLHQADAELQQLQNRASAFPALSLPKLTQVQQQVGVLRDRIQQDPLQVKTNYEQEIQPLIDQARAQILHWEKLQADLGDRLQQAKHLLTELRSLHQASQVALEESQLKTLETVDLQPPLAIAHLEALEHWLGRLEAKWTEGGFQATQVGLDNWFTQAQKALIQSQAILTQNRQPLELRLELRGRLDALKAKALARGVAENAQLTELAQQAQQLLYSRPTPLQQAADLVRQYEQCLNGGMKN